MATQTGIATSKVIVLALGAGVTGHIFLGKAPVSDLIANIQEMLSKGSHEKSGTAGQSLDTAALQNQIWRLTQEVKQLYNGRQITVLQGNTDQNNSLASYAVPIIIAGAAGYCYIWWKGWSFSDIMYVTKRNMANVVSSVTKQLEQVSTALAATKRHLTQRMAQLNDRMDEQKEITGAIREEVGQVHEDLAQMGFDIETVQRLVEGLGMKIETIEEKQDVTNAGVVYLCHFVQELAGGKKPDFLQGYSEKSRGLERLPSSFDGVSGLKGLQYFYETLLPGKDNNDENKVSNSEGGSTKTITPGPALHRTLKCY
eukprot:c19422_g1_i1 orf=216-1154(-)